MNRALLKLLPQPLQSLALLLIWLLLNNSTSAGHLLLGALLAFVIPLWSHRFWPAPKLHKPLRLLTLLPVVLWDIVVANFQVALQVLGPNARLQPGFFELPLDLDDDVAITMLASIITLTPGTVSVDVMVKPRDSRERSMLLIHALDLRDPQQTIAAIKQRYEQPLKEAFGC